MNENTLPEQPIPSQQNELTPLPPAYTINRPLTAPATSAAPQPQAVYGAQNSYTGSYSANQTYPQNFQPSQTTSGAAPAATVKTFDWKPVAAGAVIALLLGTIVYQQVRINDLSTDVAIISNDMRTSDIPMRLDGIDKKLAQVDNRLSYLDSKITATDQKAQGAIEQFKNSGNPIGNFFNSLGKSLGLNK